MNTYGELPLIRAASVLFVSAVISAAAAAQNAGRTSDQHAERSQRVETQRQHDALVVHRIRQPKGKPSGAVRAGSGDALQRIKQQDSSGGRERSSDPQTPLAIRSDSAATQLRRKGSRAAP